MSVVLTTKINGLAELGLCLRRMVIHQINLPECSTHGR